MQNITPHSLVAHSFAARWFIILSTVTIVTVSILFGLQNIFHLCTHIPYAFHTYDQLLLEVGIASYTDKILPLTPWLYLTPNNDYITIEPFLVTLNAICMVIVFSISWIFALITEQNNSTAFASGLILLSSLLTFVLPYVSSDSLIFTSVTLFALICLYRGWLKPSAPLWLTLGFFFTGLAGLSGGLIGFLIPLLSSIIFLLWRGTIKRAGHYDGALAFGIMLVMLFGWGSLILSMDNGRELLLTLVDEQIIEPFHTIIHTSCQNCLSSIETISLVWLPWTLVLLFIPWTKLYTLPHKLVDYRNTHPGQGWLWITVLIILSCTMFISTVDTLSIIPLYSTLGILTAQGLLSFSGKKSRVFYLIVSLYFLIIGVILTSIALYPFIQEYLPNIFNVSIFKMLHEALTTQELFVIASFCVLLAVILWKFTNTASPSGSLLIITCCVTLVSFTIDYYTNTTDLKKNYPTTLMLDVPDNTKNDRDMIHINTTIHTRSHTIENIDEEENTKNKPTP